MAYKNAIIKILQLMKTLWRTKLCRGHLYIANPYIFKTVLSQAVFLTVCYCNRDYDEAVISNLRTKIRRTSNFNINARLVILI